jgi:hypothetical protein
MGTQPPAIDTFEDFCDNWNWDGGRRMKMKIRNLTELLE